MNADAVVRFDADADVARITLARPPLNILTIPMIEELSAVLEAFYLVRLMATEDAAEGLRAFLEKRPPVWKDC